MEEELEKFIESGESVTVDDYGTYQVSYHDFKKVARHFAEWGAEHSGCSEKPNDLEEAAEKHASSVEGDYAFSEGPDHYCSGDLEDAFKAGAEWQARQLLQGSPMPEDTVLFNKGVAEGRRLERKEDGQ